jgi:hypothetical protein
MKSSVMTFQLMQEQMLQARAVRRVCQAPLAEPKYDVPHQPKNPRLVHP